MLTAIPWSSLTPLASLWCSLPSVFRQLTKGPCILHPASSARSPSMLTGNKTLLFVLKSHDCKYKQYYKPVFFKWNCCRLGCILIQDKWKFFLGGKTELLVQKVCYFSSLNCLQSKWDGFENVSTASCDTTCEPKKVILPVSRLLFFYGYKPCQKSVCNPPDCSDYLKLEIKLYKFPNHFQTNAVKFFFCSNRLLSFFLTQPKAPR